MHRRRSSDLCIIQHTSHRINEAPTLCPATILTIIYFFLYIGRVHDSLKDQNIKNSTMLNKKL